MDHCVFCCFWKGRDTSFSGHHRSRGSCTGVSALQYFLCGSSQNWLTQGQEQSRQRKSLQRLGSPQSRLDLFKLPRSNMLVAGFEFYFLDSRGSCFCTAGFRGLHVLTPQDPTMVGKNGPWEIARNSFSHGLRHKHINREEKQPFKESHLACLLWSSHIFMSLESARPGGPVSSTKQGSGQSRVWGLSSFI